MSKKAFEKFINKPEKAGKVKEAFRQEKKAAVRERRDAIEKHYEEKRRLKAERSSQEGTNENRSFKGRNQPSNSNNKSPRNPGTGAAANKKDHNAGPKGARARFDKPGSPASSREQSHAKTDQQRKTQFPANKESRPERRNAPAKRTTALPDRAVKPGAQRAAGEKPDYKKAYAEKPVKPTQPKTSSQAAPGTKRPFKPANTSKISPSAPAKSKGKPLNYMELLPEELAMNDNLTDHPEVSDNTEPQPEKAKRINPAERYKKKEKVAVSPAGRPVKSPGQSGKSKAEDEVSDDMPLNKFIAHAGVCSRRDAAELVKSGKITVNGEPVTEPAFKVKDDADVRMDGKKLVRSRNQVYILLNKPKDYITTAEDPQGRKTVMDIIKNATTERVYPVGRLDRNTSGVLLFTNDGDLAQKLSHPSFEVRKIYEVRLDKALQQDDFDKILNGIVLDDGEVHADSLAYADKDKSVVGIEIHSGKNRVVRRIFETLGYDVRGLDRVMYANLTKKNVERGKWRFLADKEVRLLKYFNKSKGQ